MLSRILSTLLAVAILFSTGLPVQSAPLAQGQNQGSLTFDVPPPFAMQGEIVYVLNGDLVLHDLATGATRRLTKDGQVMLPAWSPDGHFLTYSSGPDLESSDLYILGVGSGESLLLVEDACCAAWAPEGDRIAFLAVGGDDLSLDTVDASGGDRATLLSPLTDGGEMLFPAGRLHWDAYNDYGEMMSMTAPVEVIDPAAAGGLGVHRDVVEFLLGPDGLPVLDGKLLGGSTGCTMLELEEDPLVGIIAYAGDECQAGLAAARGVAAEDPEYLDLPWLSAPDFSPNYAQLAAERYLPADDPLAAPLWGVVVYDMASRAEWDLVEGASQPTWRPAPPIDPLALRQAKPGEFVVTLQPPLLLDGHEYTVSYLTTGELRQDSVSLFTVFTPEYFAQQQITTLVVSQDGQRIVTNADLLRRIFTLYPAAYHLYDQPAFTDYPVYAEEVEKVLDNPLFMAMAPGEFITVDAEGFAESRRIQTAEALRLLLQDDLAASVVGDLLASAFVEAPENAMEMVGLVDALAEKEYAYREAMRTLSYDLAVTLQDIDTVAAQAENALLLYQLVGRMLVLPNLAVQRAAWLNKYATGHESGVGALDRDQARAAADVLAEVEDANQQRIAIATELASQFVEKGLLRTAEQALQLIIQLGSKFGMNNIAHVTAGALSAGLIGLSASNLLYGGSGLVAHFRLAQRSEELRGVFGAGRAEVQAAAQQQWQSARVYDASLVESYRIALLLESLAAIQTQREYASGVAATYALPNPASLINWIRGEDWQAAVEELEATADDWERELLTDFDAPPFVEVAVTLAQDRTLTVIQGLPGDAPVKVHPAWTSYTNGNSVNNLMIADGHMWAATGGGVVGWDPATAVYTKYTVEHGLADNYVKAVLQSADGALWFGTGGNGVSRLDSDGKWTTLTADDGLAGNSVNAILQAVDGSIWLGTRDGLSRLDNEGNWTTFTTADGLARIDVYAIAQAADGALWFGTSGGGSRLDSEGHWMTFTTADGLASNTINTIAQGADGSLWFGTSSGVSWRDLEGRWTTFTAADGLADDRVQAIKQTADGALWFGTDGGVSRLDTDGHWSSYTTADGLADNWVSSITDSGDGTLWFGTLGGISSLDSRGRWTTYVTADELPGNDVWALAQAADGSIWFGTGGDGASRLNGEGDWTTFTYADGLAANGIISIAQVADGSLWFGSYNGVSRLDPKGHWTRFYGADGLADNRGVGVITQAADGSIWFGTGGGGVSRLDGEGRLTTYTTEDGLADNDVWSITQAADGALWFGGEGLISQLDAQGQWTTYTTADGVADGLVNGITQTADRALWFSIHGGGVSRLDGAGRWTTFTTADGLANSYVTSIIRAADGSLWFSTWSGGVSRYDPTMDPSQATAQTAAAALPQEITSTEAYDPEVEAIVNRAQQFEREGNWLSSIDIYSRALSASRTEDQLMRFLGRALVEQAKYAPSERSYKLAQDTDFDQVLTLTPADVSQMSRLDLLRAAEIVLQEAQRVNPLYIDHTANLARLYRVWADLTGDDAELRQRMLDKSITAYDMAVQLSPNVAHLWNEKGNTHLVRGENDLAEAAYQHGLSLDPRYDVTYVLLADFYDRTQQSDKAVELLRRGIEELPDNEQLYNYLGVFLARQGDLVGAIEAHLRLLEILPGNTTAMRNLAVLYRDTGDLEQALNWTEKAIAATDPNNVGELNNLQQFAEELDQTRSTAGKD